MNIRLNDQELQISDTDNQLIPLLKENDLFHSSGIAIAINDEIVPKDTWQDYQIKEQDNILVITATAGG